MKTLLIFFALASPLAAEIIIPVSIKVILGPSGEWPNSTQGGVVFNSEQEIIDNIDWTNEMLARKGHEFRLKLPSNIFIPALVETVANQSQWFDVLAREESGNLEAAVFADPEAYKFRDDHINIYINNSRSGSCSCIPGQARDIIFVGVDAYRELLIHEIGHFFQLNHTHPGDNDGDDDNPNDWGDGDGLFETLDDDPDASAQQINARYPNETQDKRDDLIFNIMSYHQPQDRFTWSQRQLFLETSNKIRDDISRGKGIFLSFDGVDKVLGVDNDGQTIARRIATLQHAQDVKETDNDVILIRGIIDNASGTYTSPQVWMKWRDVGILK